MLLVEPRADGDLNGHRVYWIVDVVVVVAVAILMEVMVHDVVISDGGRARVGCGGDQGGSREGAGIGIEQGGGAQGGGSGGGSRVKISPVVAVEEGGRARVRARGQGRGVAVEEAAIRNPPPGESSKTSGPWD